MKSHQNGMTLIELMIVVAIIGILAAIAYPSYQEQVRRSGRTDGKVALEQRAQALEKCYTRYMDFTNNACNPLFADRASENQKYTVGLSPGTRATTTYTLRAVPQGSQLPDAKCGTLTLDSTGLKGITGTAPTPEECWRR